MMIRKIDGDELGAATTVIRKGFHTVAQQFHLTVENCPTNGAFLPQDFLMKDRADGAVQLGAFEDGEMVGYVQLKKAGDGICEMEKLSVDPVHRHKKIGSQLISAAKEYAGGMKCKKICIGIIEENTRLKLWYQSLGFLHTGTETYPDLPFTVGRMEINL